MTVLDAHCDAPSQMLRLRDYGKDNEFAQVDFPKMKRGGVDASFFALYIPANLKDGEATAYAFRLLDELERQLAANSDKAAFARNSREVLDNKEKGLISVLIGMENASALQQDFRLLEEFYRRGVRYITLTHSADNAVGDSCTGKGTWGGLSSFGKELVKEMNRIGMLIDLAHSADSTIDDVLSLSQKPVAYTHGCCRALSPHKRNLPDSLIKGIADSGGVLGMSIYPPFLSKEFVEILDASKLEDKMWIEDEFIKDPGNAEKAEAWHRLQKELQSLPRPGIGRVLEHIAHAADVAGVAHVGIGTDYDGIECTAEGLETIASLPSLFAAMKSEALFSEDEIAGIAGENFLNCLDSVA